MVQMITNKQKFGQLLKNYKYYAEFDVIVRES